VVLFSWGVLRSMVAMLCPYEPPPEWLWYRRGPLRVAARMAPRDPLAADTFTAVVFPPKFWALVLILLGFLPQVMAALGGP
jgi:hypothetical protein